MKPIWIWLIALSLFGCAAVPPQQQTLALPQHQTLVTAPAPDFCVATAIYREARGEPIAGQRRVAAVIQERALRSGKRPCEIVYERHLRQGRVTCQFTFACQPMQRIREPAAWQRALELSAEVQPAAAATCYDTRQHPEWGQLLAHVGHHFFYDCYRVPKTH